MRTIQSPGKYIQGPDALSLLNSYIKPLGSRWLILVDAVMPSCRHAVLSVPILCWGNR